MLNGIIMLFLVYISYINRVRIILSIYDIYYYIIRIYRLFILYIFNDYIVHNVVINKQKTEKNRYLLKLNEFYKINVFHTINVLKKYIKDVEIETISFTYNKQNVHIDLINNNITIRDNIYPILLNDISLFSIDMCQECIDVYK